MKIHKHLYIRFFIFFMLEACIAHSQTSVLTQHNDLYRTGWNNKEIILNTKNVNKTSFGEIFSRTVDDQIYAQPLVVLNVNIPGNGSKNIVIVATVNNTVYAFDADSANVVNPYWQIHLTPAGSRPVLNTDMNTCLYNGFGYKDFSGNIGIVGTPVIDSVTNTMYFVARSVTSSNTFQQFLHAIDITTGAERPNSPVLITAQVKGTGDGNVAGVITFNSQKQNQRPGLLLLNGIVYITWAAHCDWAPYHGWIIGYDKTSLQQKIVYNSTPNGYGGGIWMSALAPSADSAGNIYVSVGNGSVGVTNDSATSMNRAESALKLTPKDSILTVSSFFTPQNYQYLDSTDLDFGAPGMLLIPNTNRVLTGSKDGHLYLLNRDSMGGYDSISNKIIQTITIVNSKNVVNLEPSRYVLRSSLAYYKGAQKEFIYSWSESASLHAFPYDRNADTINVQNAITSCVQGPRSGNGSFLSLSSNGSVDSTAILWVNQAANGADANQNVVPGVLRAFSAADVTKELWNSEQYPIDNSGNYAKFNCPTISNGKVYLATFSNKLMVYGLRSSADTCGLINIALNKTAVASIAAPGLPASAAFDGTLCTRWGSSGADSQWIYVDLGARYDLCEAVIRWETAFGKNFDIQVSEDAVNWRTIDSIRGNINQDNYLPLQGSGRYVRMYGITQGRTNFGFSIWEFEVHGKLSSNQCGNPLNLAVSNIFANAATLHWQGNGASKFNVQYKTVADSNWTTLSSDTNNLIISGLSCAKNYMFGVQNICNANDTGTYSPSTTFSTLSCTSLNASGNICPGGSTTLSINLSATTYKWQLNKGAGFTNIVDDSNYTGSNTANLKLNNIPSAWYGYQYRCVFDTSISNPVILKFINTWTGSVNNSWENPANWSCGELPDVNTDVIINAGTVIVNSSPNVRSLTLSSGVNFTINPNFKFTINH